MPTRTLPTLRGTLAASGPWQSLFARASHRVYPYQMGCFVKSASTGTTVAVNGVGEFAAGDYVLPCSKVQYGDAYYYIPDLTRITKVTAVSESSDNSSDTLTLETARSLAAGEFLLNIGADTGGSTPNYDGTDITLYTDPVGNAASSYDYFLTSQGGEFHGWITGGYEVVDLLVMNSSGTPIVVIPTYEVGPEIVS